MADEKKKEYDDMVAAENAKWQAEHPDEPIPIPEPPELPEIEIPEAEEIPLPPEVARFLEGVPELPSDRRCHPHPAWSHDGRRVYFNSADSGAHQVYVVDVSSVVPAG